MQCFQTLHSAANQNNGQSTTNFLPNNLTQCLRKSGRLISWGLRQLIIQFIGCRCARTLAAWLVSSHGSMCVLHRLPSYWGWPSKNLKTQQTSAQPHTQTLLAAQNIAPTHPAPSQTFCPTSTWPLTSHSMLCFANGRVPEWYSYN